MSLLIRNQTIETLQCSLEFFRKHPGSLKGQWAVTFEALQKLEGALQKGLEKGVLQLSVTEIQTAHQVLWHFLTAPFIDQSGEVRSHSSQDYAEAEKAFRGIQEVIKLTPGTFFN